MNALFLALVITAAQIVLGLAMGCAAFRMLRGPRAQDRVLGLDTLYLTGMLCCSPMVFRPAAPSISRRRWSSRC